MLQNWLSHSHNECTHDMPEKDNHPESAIDPEALVSIKALQADYGDELLNQVIKTTDPAGNTVKTLPVLPGGRAFLRYRVTRQ